MQKPRENRGLHDEALSGLLVPTYHAALPLVNLRFATISNQRLERAQLLICKNPGKTGVYIMRR